MNKESLKNITCPFCGLSNSHIRYSFDECAIVRCDSCSLMWLYPVPSLAELSEVYGEEYFYNKSFLSENKNEQLYGYVDYIAERINKQYDYQKIVKIAKDRSLSGRGLPIAEQRWLDVGCGLGYLLDVAFDEGFRVSGIEFNSSAVDYIRSKFTFEVRHGDINEIDIEEKFDVISIIDVIEHLHDPFKVAKKLRELISDDGLLILGTMDSDSWVSRLLGKRLEDFRRVREHLFFFNRNSITNVLSDNGWEIVAIESFGHTFQLKLLLGRVSLMFPVFGKILKSSIYPSWLLDANFYLNPKTKMLVFAKPKRNLLVEMSN